MKFITHQTFVRIGSVALLLMWAIFLLARPINLMVADLGRHLQNGRVLVSALEQSDHALTGAILHTNFYSATQANFPFINHHWGSGVILYGVFLFGGFSLLSVFFKWLKYVKRSLSSDVISVCISGDISESYSLEEDLTLLSSVLDLPVYFVL
jgi:hypothetical protein